ncbi:hypothetical protein HID58_055035, partial [Brassica napus]
MAVDERDDHQESTPREAELQKQIDGLQSQVTDMQKAREAAENPELTSEVQSLKEKLGEHSKQLEQSAEKLNQLQTENATLRDQNKASNAASNKKRRFNARVRPMGNLDTPSTREGNTNESTPREAELQKQIDGLQSQMTDMQKAREAAENPELTSEVQSLKEKLGDHSKQLEPSAEKLNQLQTENATLRDQNKASNAASNKKRPLNARVRPMGNLDTPSTGEGNTNVTSAAGA